MPLLIAILLALLATSQAARACADQTPCQLGDRSYHVKVPDDWDGTTPMPVMLHFHGWARQGTLIVKHRRISGETRKRSVLLLAPNGRGKSWDFWNPSTEDVAFAEAVIEDAARRFPIDRSRVFVSGYSFGSAMAWRFACESGLNVSALLAVSGSLDQSEDCRHAPAEIRHVHGLSDTVMRYPFGPGGDLTYPVALWRSRLGCDAQTDQSVWNVTTKDVFVRYTWADCDVDGPVHLDVHKRGHFIPVGWFGRQLDELLGLPPQG